MENIPVFQSSNRRWKSTSQAWRDQVKFGKLLHTDSSFFQCFNYWF